MKYLFPRGKKGLTFVEILLVSSLFSLIGIALFVSFSNGIRLWERSQQLVVEEDVAIFFDKFGRDVNNMLNYSTIPFDGLENQLSFGAHILDLADENSSRAHEGMVHQIGHVQFMYDGLSRQVTRRQSTYGEFQSHVLGPERVLLKDVDGVEWRYYYPGEDGFRIGDVGREQIPSGIEVTVRFSDHAGERSMRRFINVPLGS